MSGKWLHYIFGVEDNWESKIAKLSPKKGKQSTTYGDAENAQDEEMENSYEKSVDKSLVENFLSMNIDADSDEDSIDENCGRAHTAICEFLVQDHPASDKRSWRFFSQ